MGHRLLYFCTSRRLPLQGALNLSWGQKRRFVAACNTYLAALGPILHQQQTLLSKAEVPTALPPKPFP